MWNNFAEIAQNPSTKRLGLALFASIILHVFLVRGFNFNLPSLKKEFHSIEARLQMPKVVINQLPQQPTPEPPAEPLIPYDKLEAAPDVVSEPTQEPQVVTTNSAEPESPQLQKPESETPVIEPVASTQESQPVDTGLIINENAYQYVETDFDVRTEIDGSAQGKAKITYNLLDGKQYQLKSLIQATGLAALVISDLLQTSAGTLTKNGLQPTSYLYQYGDKADKTYAANFDWQAKKVSLITAKGTKIEDIADGTQDLLSFMYQFMHVAPLQRMQISIATGKKLSTYDYAFEGEENINSALGEIKTIHIFREGFETEEKTELWLALDYQYLPVKIRKTEKDGKVYELVATRITTTRPTQNN